MKVLFLGTGNSTGVPVIGCNCEICQSAQPRNKRLRSSVLIRSKETTLLIDSSPDLRQQALRFGITSIDAILYTHAHLDHISGFDELRAFCWHREGKLPLYAGTQSMAQLKRMYNWAFLESNTNPGYIHPEAHIHDGKSIFSIGDLSIQPIAVKHSKIECYGYIIREGENSFGYFPDVNRLPEEKLAAFRNLDVLALDALSDTANGAHLSISENIDYMLQLQPRRGFVTHMGHRLDYDKLSASLPAFMAPAYDGLELDINQH